MIGKKCSIFDRNDLLPRQSSLVKGAGQIQVPVVSLQRPPLKQATPSVPQVMAEQSSPVKPAGHRQVGGS